jgi:hypothetical protein
MNQTAEYSVSQLSIFPHFDYLRNCEFEESKKLKIKLDLIEFHHFEELSKMKNNRFKIEEYLSPGDLVEIFAVAAYFSEVRIMEEIIRNLTSDSKNIHQVLQIYLIRQSYDLPLFDSRSIFGFFDLNFQELIENRLFPNLEVKFLRRILNRRTLNLKSDIQIIDGIYVSIIIIINKFIKIIIYKFIII